MNYPINGLFINVKHDYESNMPTYKNNSKMDKRTKSPLIPPLIMLLAFW